MIYTSRSFVYFVAMKGLSIIFTLLLTGVVHANTAATADVTVAPQLLSKPVYSAKSSDQDHEEEFHFLKEEIKRFKEGWFNMERLKKETARMSALYDQEDKAPADIVLRRTKVLLENLSQNGADPKTLKKITNDIKLWEKNNQSAPPKNEEEEIENFKKLCSIRRALSFSNPLLNFDKIAFLTHYTQRQGKGEIHIVDQYFGFNAKPGGAPYILENPFSERPSARQLINDTPVSKGANSGKKLENGSFLSMNLSYDAKKMFFAWTQAVSTPITGEECWDENFGTRKDIMRRDQNYRHYFWASDRVYHIYSLDFESGELRQLTEGPYNTYDPCELPNGRLVYISEKQGGNQRCGARWITAGVLHSMKQDGSDSYPLSFHETNEWHPSVNNDGMIVYTRWDYVDRDDCGAHHLWQCYPDGRDPRAPHGNYAKERELRPCIEFSFRAIPGSRKLAAVAAAHHGIAYGSLITVDPFVPDDGAMSQVKRVTPEVHFMETEKSPGYSHPLGKFNSNPNAEHFGTPWPLSEDFYLCVYARNRTDYGIYLVDSFGNRELLWQDAAVPCLDPIPFRPIKRPPVIPDMTTQSEDKKIPGKTDDGLAEVFVNNVYETERPLPEGTKIKWLRVVNVFPKSTSFMNEPNIGMAHQSLARGSLGIAPVEKDGSVFFKMPINVNVYFQLLDENMQAVHSMKSSTYAHSGERLSCIGCHETPLQSPKNNSFVAPLALKKKPAQLIPEPDGSFPLTFPRLVQPVLDKHCVSCHAREEKAPNLDGNTWYMAKNKEGVEEKKNVRHGWSNGFSNLSNLGWGRHGGNGSHWHQNKFTYTIPGDVGAHASKLIPFLKKGHHNINLSKDDWHRLTLWIDLNTNFYGAYENTEAQAKGEIVLPKFGVPKQNPLTVNKKP